MKLTVKEILDATGGKVISGSTDSLIFTGMSIDSRTVREGDIFVALKGQRFDGHDFIMDSMNIARGAIVSVPPAWPIKGKIVIHVNNTLKALQDIAHYVRKQKGIPVIGITGTNGKTTTKELISSILSISHRVLKNSGNLNNHIGMPLSLSKIEDDHEYAVIEMGASIKGDIELLCDIANPNYGVITNIGPGHLEGFGSIETVRNTKLELYDSVRTIALNADDEFLVAGISEKTKGPEVITFGIKKEADVYAKEIELGDRSSVFNICLKDGGCVRTRLSIAGMFNIYNALAAAAVCNAVGIGIDEIKKGIEMFEGVPMRLEFKEIKGVTVISDVYNANPASMEEAVKELVRLRKKRAIVVLGDMLELGAYSEEAHRKLGKWMSGLPVDMFIAVGPMMEKAAEEFSSSGRQSATFADAKAAREFLFESCSEGDTVLVKGSRSMNMEKVVENNRLPKETANAI